MSVPTQPATPRGVGVESTPYKLRVVEDEPAQRRLARATLAAPNDQVIEAADDRQAVERLHGEDFGVALLDRRMPEMDGHAVLRHIRNVMGALLLPEIRVTAHGSGGDDISLVMGLSASDFVRKPCDPLELMARVARDSLVFGRALGLPTAVARMEDREDLGLSIFTDIARTGALAWARGEAVPA